jgi:hypothetical protein
LSLLDAHGQADVGNKSSSADSTPYLASVAKDGKPGGLESKNGDNGPAQAPLDSNPYSSDSATKNGKPGGLGPKNPDNGPAQAPADSKPYSSDSATKDGKPGGLPTDHGDSYGTELKTAHSSTDSTSARDLQLAARYTSDTPRAEFKYTGLNNNEVSDYRKLDEGKEQPGGGPDGKGWDNAVEQNPDAQKAEEQLKQQFDQMKQQNDSTGSKPSEEQMQKLDQLNKQFIDTLRETVKGNPDMLKQLDVLESLYQKRNRALFQKPGGASSDM